MGITGEVNIQAGETPVPELIKPEVPAVEPTEHVLTAADLKRNPQLVGYKKGEKIQLPLDGFIAG